MARFRIVQRPSGLTPGAIVYDIQERTLWWWSTISPSWLSLAEAEEEIEDIRNRANMDSRPTVVKEYN